MTVTFLRVRQSKQPGVADHKFIVAIEQDKDRLRGRGARKGILRKILKDAKISAGELEQLAKVFIPR
jgi:hypothetical protein